MIGLFTYKYVQYKRRAVHEVMGACVYMAKVCRDTVNWLRNKTKVIVVAIALGVGIPRISHLACDFPRLLSAILEEYELMIQYFGVTGIVMVVPMAIAPTFLQLLGLEETE
ncbi:hypothetical protein M9H77_36335 [Catharanthus roseus]|uniref:Uncharacterized protein n=1 Tax=Catharanthus roseus TaxID=4058 RepID=A0ACB9ZRW0_CATRO|nr:hypothetical protein M9H77_36335 [Catharanthus roseus]